MLLIAVASHILVLGKEKAETDYCSESIKLMGIKTEDMVKNLPPKEMTAGVDWLGIADSFDPTKLEQKYLNECARRNSYDTCYRWEPPLRPMEDRLSDSEFGIKIDRQNLEDWIHRIETEGLNPSLYKNARMALIRLLGSMGAHEYNLREYNAMGEKERRRLTEEWKAYEERVRMQYEEAAYEPDEDDYYDYYYVASVHEKIIRIRKGFKDSAGKPMTQRDFAKFLEYPINKYAEAEKVDKWGKSNEEESPVEDELLEKLIFRCHANPYWLYDYDCEPEFGQEDMAAEIVRDGDEPSIYARPDVILKWVKEGKPRETRWEEGRME